LIDIQRLNLYLMKSMKKTPQITKSLLKKSFGLTVKKVPLYEAALTHPSFRHENQIKAKLEDFDRLEFLGDSILNEVICQRIYADFPDADEGMLSKLRSILVSQKILSRIAAKFKLHNLIRLGNSLGQAMKTPYKFKLMTDSMESIFAAVFFDLGRKKTEAFILKHYAEYIDAKRLFRLDPNPKSTLQELTLKKWQKLPQYTHKFGPKGVTTTVSIDRRRKASGFHKIKKESELKAARALLKLLRQEQ